MEVGRGGERHGARCTAAVGADAGSGMQVAARLRAAQGARGAGGAGLEGAGAGALTAEDKKWMAEQGALDLLGAASGAGAGGGGAARQARKKKELDEMRKKTVRRAAPHPAAGPCAPRRALAPRGGPLRPAAGPCEWQAAAAHARRRFGGARVRARAGRGEAGLV